MDNNDLLRRLRYALRCDDAETSKLIILGGGIANANQAAAWRVREGEPGFKACTGDDIRAFLAGLILDRRGPMPTEKTSKGPWPVKKKVADDTPMLAGTGPQVDNNAVLKQLRIALSLRSDDLHAILKQGGSALSAGEASALFRNPEARNFRVCGDQVLRHFIKGLAEQRNAEKPE